MLLTRRELFAAGPANALAWRGDPARWTAAWDHAVLAAAVERLGSAWDEEEAMLLRRAGPEYRYHTNMRDAAVHPTRDSLEYALLLLESGRPDRAHRTIDRLVSIQESDPKSKWYGLWGYYLEEPAPKMSPADWNWADFLGALLLEIEFRHGARLPASLRARVLEAIRHAAYSVRRRNVAMTYTNIAAQGTFVTLAAAELLGDADLRAYAADRLGRFARTVDETGSFAEYNSPTYANVTIANLTRIRMFVKDEAARALAGRIEGRAWLHLGRHWHAPTMQLAGPMSRCYSTDIGKPLWLQKALRGALAFATLDDVKRAGNAGEVAILDYNCPDDYVGPFLSVGSSHEHREILILAGDGIRPVQGTTWLTPDFCLGSVNRGTFWIQSRPLLAYWGDHEGAARYLQARVLKDDYDFASALLYSVQSRNYVVGLVTFRHPGGDKHPSLDPLPNPFSCSRLRLRFDIAGLPENAPVLLNGEPAETGRFARGTRAAIDLGWAWLWLRPIVAGFAVPDGRVTLAREDGLFTISIDLLPPGGRRELRFPEVAYALFLLALEKPGGGALADFDRRLARYQVSGGVNDALVRVRWSTPAGELGLEGVARSGDISGLDRAFRETIDGKPVPLVRLS